MKADRKEGRRARAAINSAWDGSFAWWGKRKAKSNMAMPAPDAGSRHHRLRAAEREPSICSGTGSPS